MRAPTLILGIGNLLLRDEGVGVHVVEALAEMELPDGVEVLDGGTAGADLVDVIADRERVIVVDALDADAEPGTIARLGAAGLVPQEGESISLHQVGLVETLHMAHQLGCAPAETIVLGIQPAEIAPGLELTPEVAAAVPRVVKLILDELHAQR